MNARTSAPPPKPPAASQPTLSPATTGPLRVDSATLMGGQRVLEIVHFVGGGDHDDDSWSVAGRTFTSRLIVAAIDARRGELFYAFYRQVPGGVQRLTESLSDEVKDRGITVNAISPGPIAADEEPTDAATTAYRAAAVAKVPLGRLGVADDIAEVVAAWTGIPAGRLLEGESEKLLRMEEELGHRVVGQKEAVREVSDAVRRARAGIADPNRPTGSFLFLGPTGVGKTELAKALAEFLFDDERAMVRIDMSEYSEKHSVSRLVGAPPGYVGYDEGGYLTEAVRRNPYSVLLLDEVEKAHPDVFNILLQVLDDGRLTDGQGRTVDFKNTVIVMTSNIGSPIIQSMVGQDSQDIKDAVWDELKSHFRPEFLNRIDETVVFHGLDADHIASIAAIQLKILASRLTKMDLTLDVSPAALAELAKVGFDPVFGARPLKRAIQQRIENPLSKLLLEGKFLPKDTIAVNVDPVRAPGEFAFTKAEG